MAEPTEQKPNEQSNAARFAELTVQVLSFDKLIVAGLMVCLILVLVFSFVIPFYSPPNEKACDFVLAFFKDIGLILVGALANSVRHKDKGGFGAGS